MTNSKRKAPGLRPGAFLFLYYVLWEGLNPQAGYQLMFTVQPFADNVTYNTCHNGNQECQKPFHDKHPLSVPL